MKVQTESHIISKYLRGNKFYPTEQIVHFRILRNLSFTSMGLFKVKGIVQSIPTKDLCLQ